MGKGGIPAVLVGHGMGGVFLSAVRLSAEENGHGWLDNLHCIVNFEAPMLDGNLAQLEGVLPCKFP